MPSSTVTVGELLYEASVNFTKVTEYGTSFEAITSGKAAPPPQGARFDVYFEGALTGPRVKGTVVGVDYLNMRGDGRGELHIHAEITDSNGEKVSFFADGVVTPEEGFATYQLRENVHLTTASPTYTWVNTLQVWGIGKVHLAKAQVQVKAYAA